MKYIYIVYFNGGYQGTSMKGVFDTKQKAKYFISKLTYKDDCWIEKIELNKRLQW